MRIRTDHLRVDERRTLTLSRVIDGSLHGVVARQQVAAIHFLDEEVGERAHELGDATTGGVDLDRNRDRVPVILDQINDGQLEVRRRIKGFPELSLAGGAITGRDQHYLVLLKAVGDVEQLGAERSLRCTDALKELGSG